MDSRNEFALVVAAVALFGIWINLMAFAWLQRDPNALLATVVTAPPAIAGITLVLSTLVKKPKK